MKKNNGENVAAGGHMTAAIRFTAFSVVVSLLCIIIGCAAGIFDPTRMRYASSDSGTNTNVPNVMVVIDPGHGGEDGGASGANGTYEKTLNLAIAKILCSQLLAGGIPAVLTREEDKMLYDKYGELSDYTGHKKTYDLRNRLRMTEEYEEPVFVSIHMNSFPVSKYSGLQVFYSPKNETSKILADTVQSTVRNYIQPNNNRETKRADSSIYLLDRLTCPAVLVECGFISNQEECEKLCSVAYQRELAATIYAAIAEYLALQGKL
ncbi:MAG TPA: N-acetylmuramoyl-L-alanine amidase [Bacillota bacterium]|nr:N-acetylmuramoyl-L-alanine amidase [Bacillota bacterium]